MAKRSSPSSQLHELGERVQSLEEHLQGIEARLEPLSRLELELARLRELVLEGVEQAQDAHSMSSGLDAGINHLTLAVAEGLQHVDRAEKRIHGVVTRARRLLHESGLESQGLRQKLHSFNSSMAEHAQKKGCRPCQKLWRLPKPTRF